MVEPVSMFLGLCRGCVYINIPSFRPMGEEVYLGGL